MLGDHQVLFGMIESRTCWKARMFALATSVPPFTDLLIDAIGKEATKDVQTRREAVKLYFHTMVLSAEKPKESTNVYQSQ